MPYHNSREVEFRLNSPGCKGKFCLPPKEATVQGVILTYLGSARLSNWKVEVNGPEVTDPTFPIGEGDQITIAAR
jgi:hypothetical protein